MSIGTTQPFQTLLDSRRISNEEKKKEKYRRDGYQVSEDNIRKSHSWCFWLIFGGSLIVVALIWLVRLHYFALTLSGKDLSWAGYWRALGTAGYAVLVPSGIASGIATFASFTVMFCFWKQFLNYLFSTRVGPDRPEGDNARRTRARAALHEPPGDIFTLVGIGSTFLGLAMCLVSLPIQELFDAAAGNTNSGEELGTAIVAVAITFGSSLAIGLVSSMQGIAFALCARWLAAKYSVAVKSPAQVSEDFDHLENLSEIGARMEFMFGNAANSGSPATETAALHQKLFGFERVSAALQNTGQKLVNESIQSGTDSGLSRRALDGAFDRTSKKLIELIPNLLSTAYYEVLALIRPKTTGTRKRRRGNHRSAGGNPGSGRKPETEAEG